MHAFAYKNGSMHCEGVNLADIAAAVGTPTFVYSRKTIVEDLAEFREAFAPLNAHIAYAVKACSNKAILNLMAQQGITVEDIRTELAGRHIIDHKTKQEKMT